MCGFVVVLSAVTYQLHDVDRKVVSNTAVFTTYIETRVHRSSFRMQTCNSKHGHPTLHCRNSYLSAYAWQCILNRLSRTASQSATISYLKQA